MAELQSLSNKTAQIVICIEATFLEHFSSNGTVCIVELSHGNPTKYTSIQSEPLNCFDSSKNTRIYKIGS